VNAGVTPPGTIKRPDNATYSHAYLELMPFDVIKISKQFSSSQTGTDGSVGTYCWSGNTTVYAYTNSPPTQSTSCGNTPVAGAALTTNLNSLGGTLSFSATASFTNAGSQGNVNLKGYLMDANNKLSTAGAKDTMGTVVTLGALYPLNTPLVVTDKSKGVGISYNYSWGAEVFSTPKILFEGGPPNFKFTVN
jgi:hypothetical protein